MNPTRYALGLTDGHGSKWLALDARTSGPMRTRDIHRAHTWDGPAELQAWLDAVPEMVEVKGVPTPGGRKWLRGLALYAVPLTVVVGSPEPLVNAATPVLEDARS